jgi:outer membrane lipoprotein-sorting protein
MRRLGIRARWAVPVSAVAVTGIVIVAATVASANAAPSLPSRTPEQLLTEIVQGSAKPLGPLTATVQETSDLGLPALPLPQQGSTGVTSGPGSVSIWYRDPQHVRIAQQVQAGETDLRLDGRTLWVWSSKNQTATRYQLPAQALRASQGRPASAIPNMPQAAAAQLLSAIGKTTVVSVQRNVYVAGQAAYQLSLVPRSSKSLVGSVLIAIDASRHIPLRLEVFPRGSATAAYSIGFTSLTFGTPAASNFSFSPPPGATVKKVTVPASAKAVLRQAGLGQAGLGQLGLGQSGLGSAGLNLGQIPLGSTIISSTVHQAQLPEIPAKGLRIPAPALKQLEAQFAKSLPASMSKAQRAAAIKSFDQSIGKHLLGRHGVTKVVYKGGGFGTLQASGLPGWTAYAPLTAAAAGKAPQVIGTGWLSVLATPPSPEVAAAVQQALHGGLGSGQPRTSVTYGSSSPSSVTAYSSTLSVSPAAGPDLAALQAVLKAATPVHGSWGSGRLLKTTLLTVLVTSKGQVLIGAVTPSVLYADVAADAG